MINWLNNGVSNSDLKVQQYTATNQTLLDHCSSHAFAAKRHPLNTCNSHQVLFHCPSTTSLNPPLNVKLVPALIETKSTGLLSKPYPKPTACYLEQQPKGPVACSRWENRGKNISITSINSSAGDSAEPELKLICVALPAQCGGNLLATSMSPAVSLSCSLYNNCWENWCNQGETQSLAHLVPSS